MRKAILAIALISVFTAPAALLAQSPDTGRQFKGAGHGPNVATMVQHEVARLTTLLTLTPGEVTSVSTLLTNYYTSNEALMPTRRAAEKALRTAEANNDSAGIQAASSQIGTVMGQLTANRSTLNAGMAQTLTAQQLTIWKALGAGGRGGFGGGRGFGGPGRPGAPPTGGAQ